MATWVVDFAIPQIGWTFQEIFETTLLHRFVLLDQLLKEQVSNEKTWLFRGYRAFFYPVMLGL